MAAQTRQN